MLEPHPPHASLHTWKDFFIHIATIVIGLLIAVGLEQTVEAIHHHHQRQALLEQMREEANHNLPFEQDSITRLLAQMAYLRELRSVLVASPSTDGKVRVHGVQPRGGGILHVSPSRAVWAAAVSGGVASILPAPQAQLFTRRDSNAQWEEQAEAAMYSKLRELVGQCDRSGFHYEDPAPAYLSEAQRGDVLLALVQLIMQMEEFTIRIAIEQGADKAVADGAESLDAMYPYQARSVAALGLGSGTTGNFFGSDSQFEYKLHDTPRASKP